MEAQSNQNYGDAEYREHEGSWRLLEFLTIKPKLGTVHGIGVDSLVVQRKLSVQCKQKHEEREHNDEKLDWFRSQMHQERWAACFHYSEEISAMSNR